MSIDYQAIANKWDEAVTLAQSYENAPEKFKAHSANGETTITYCEHTEGTIIKGECIVSNCKASELIAVMENTDQNVRQHFDFKSKSLKVLETFTHGTGPQYTIRHYVVFSPAVIVSERDFLYVEHHKIEGNTTTYLTTSIDGMYPADKCESVGVRATNIFSYFKMVEEGNDLRVVSLGQANPNGLIPTALANKVVYERPLAIVAAAKHIGKSTKGV